jgi:hypothetical protein
VFFVALLAGNLIFILTAMRLASYIIVTGILLLVYVLIGYAIARAVK